ncbi:MAG: hypothetical protein NTW30_05670 [Candidatus Aenigmarchaeota archaeon]|nr:hypothetical protein [Candidatus Aenigmarchaeota archaeon]
MCENEEINDEGFLFPSAYRRYSKKKRGRTPISMREIQQVIHDAAKNAGLKHWKYITPQSLRKTFNNNLRDQKENSRLDKADQEFFMGHLLPGAQEHYFVREMVEDLREKFAKMKFKPRMPSDECKQKIINLCELDDYIKKGWRYINHLPDGTVIIEKLE